MKIRIGDVPASFFGIVLGLAGLGSAWRVASYGREIATVLYLVSATVAAALGFPQAGKLFFGAGMFSWLATGEPLPAALRPTLGIQLAPPVVCCTAYLAINGGATSTGANLSADRQIMANSGFSWACHQE